MKRVRGLVRAVVTITGVISLSSPLVASTIESVTQEGSMHQKDGHGIAAEGACDRETRAKSHTTGQGEEP